MADHDRDAGSRGEEEAPRDPTPGEEQPAALPPGEPPTSTSYGYTSYAHTMPGGAPPGWGAEPPPRSDTFKDFFRQKPAQILAAGLLGLLFGVLLGGGAVAALTSLDDRHDRWQDYPRVQRIPGSDCLPHPSGSYCVFPQYPVHPMPSMYPYPYPPPYPVQPRVEPRPMPTRTVTLAPPTRVPTPVPTRTG
ncbi:hypothetical protein HII36_25980 [Nonomuraea sp. NN258]|uniref:hypothetical protein n=1 Tax=Nonomuraea antri TaxID=2730852 RepID=UPI0015689DD7|nr:hypothetical protein [Nonomuraea antri]NRQ35248.1 hypothetical protein [Nonomuraea antri]